MKNKEASMNQEVAKASSKEVSTSVSPRGAGEELDVEDVQMPKALLMQGLSDLVTEGKAKIGEYRDSISGALLGEEKKPVEMLVFDSNKTWVESLQRPGEKKARYLRTVPMTAANKDLPYEEDHKEGKLIRVKTWNYYILIADKNISEATPYALSFSRTASGAARKLGLFFSRMNRKGLDSWSHVIRLTSYTEKNDQGTFSVPDVELGREAKEEEKLAAEYWYEAMRSSRVKVTVHDEKAAEVVTAPGTVNVKEREEDEVPW